MSHAISHWVAINAIRATLERYFYGLDTRDAQVLATCFTDTAHYEANTGGGRRIVFTGAAEIGDSLARLLTRFDASLHQGVNPAIQVTDDTAQVDLFATARMVHTVADPNTEPRQVIYVRGLRYRDHLVRQGEDWKITHRVHQALWQHDAQAVPPYVPPAPGIG